MVAGRPRLAPSSLLGGVWDLGEDGLIRLTEAGASAAAEAEAWPNRFVEWSWGSIVRQSHEVYALNSNGRVVAIWASEPKRLLELPNVGSCYRIDFLEVIPELRGSTLAYFTAAIAAERALEAGADAIVLASLPEARNFWENTVGASVGSIHGWHVPGTLLTCTIHRAVLDDLRSDANEHQKTEEFSGDT